MATRKFILWPLSLLVFSVAAVLAQSGPDVTIVSESGRDSIPVSEFSGVPMIPLAAVAELVSAQLRPASEQGVSISANGKVARISDGRNFVPVEGKLVLLQSPARLVSGQWFVPLDFIPKVLQTLSREPLTYREADRLLIVGDAFPVLDVRASRDPSFTRVEVTTNRPVPMEVTQLDRAIRISIRAPFLETDFRDEEILDEVVERITLHQALDRYELTVYLGARFGTLKKFDRDYPEHGVVLDLLRSRVPTTAAGSPGQIETIDEDLRPIEERGEQTGGETPGETPTNVTTIELPEDFGTPSPALSSDLRGRDRSEPTELRTVVIDPGHGGPETGAEGQSGLVEKDLVLSLSRRLRTLLSERLGIRVILTRDGDGNPAHDERAAIANNNKADLFISVHADASPSREARGSSVYFLSYSSSEAGVTSAGGARTTATRAAGGGSGLDFILWDMAQTSHLSQSSRLAEIFQDELLKATGSEKVNRGIKQNTFRVLKGATMPAVLVEVGFISNLEEEQLLKSDAYQERISEALYRGVLRFKELYDYQPAANGGAHSQGKH
jgi:N-acetylmuramoyl-L-alanine amidase